jgi:hypothetical protein
MTTPDPSAARFRTSVVRRVLGAFAALALAGALSATPALSAAAAPTRSAGVARAAAAADLDGVTAADLLAVLDDDAERALRDGIPHVPGTGLRLGDLTAAQRAAVYGLLRALLSAEAWTHLEQLRDADAALGLDDDYRIALFGDAESDYVLQFSTPELVLSILDQDGVVEVSPDVA